MQGDPAAHRVAGEGEALAAERPHVAVQAGNDAGRARGVAVAPEVRRERAASPSAATSASQLWPRLGEAVEQDERRGASSGMMAR